MFDREVVLVTALKPDQVMDALNRRTEIRGAKVRPVAALFEGGSISSASFELRLLGQRQHATADLRGQITGSSLGSTVAVRIGLSDPFSVIWTAGCVLGALVALLSVRSWSQAPAGLCVAAGATALVVLYQFLSRRTFEVSASTAELALRDILAATRAVDGGRP